MQTMECKISYTIMISDAQRLYLIEALRKMPKSEQPALGATQWTDEDVALQECVDLLKMFEELPIVEPNARPGKMLHGFSL